MLFSFILKISFNFNVQNLIKIHAKANCFNLKLLEAFKYLILVLIRTIWDQNNVDFFKNQYFERSGFSLIHS